MLFLKRWSSFWITVLIAGIVMGCGAGVLLNPEGQGGGIAQYLYQEHDGHMLSSNRTEALRQISRYCVRSYTIIKEGPTQGRKRVVDDIAGSDVITESWWGIRFKCLPKTES